MDLSHIQKQPTVLSLPENRMGRDFVMGDIHGCFYLLEQALRQVQFEPSKDRLFSVGDLVDRGPDPEAALEWLRYPWFHAVRGNHEQMFLDLYGDGVPDDEQLADTISSNGMSWWGRTTDALKIAMLEAFSRMPIIVETEARVGLVGFLHAEPDPDLDWDRMKIRVLMNDGEHIGRLLWGRSRLKRMINNDIRGVARIFAGHTPVNRPVILGNTFHIDTAAVYGHRFETQDRGYLTLVDINASTLEFPTERPSDFVHIIKAAKPSIPIGDLNGGIPNKHDQHERGFQPR